MEQAAKLKVIDTGANVFNLAQSVSYQQGSVVSKQLIKKEAGNVTLFAFDKGQGLTEHTAPYDAMVHVLEGQAEITISKKPYVVNPATCNPPAPAGGAPLAGDDHHAGKSASCIDGAAEIQNAPRDDQIVDKVDCGGPDDGVSAVYGNHRHNG